MGRPPYTKERMLESFWERVDKTSECWLWTGGGYGVYHIQFGQMLLYFSQMWTDCNGHRMWTYGTWNLDISQIPIMCPEDYEAFLCRITLKESGGYEVCYKTILE